MRPLYLPNTAQNKSRFKRQRYLGAISLITFGLTMAIAGFAGTQERQTLDPMEDKYSLEIRNEYAQCRKEKNPMAQYFCTCRVLEKQCEAPRRIDHGDWNTVEFWPSDDARDREVQFILFMAYDILGDFSPINKGVVMTCMAGVSEVNVFVGENVDPDITPTVTINDVGYTAAFENEDGSYILGFEETSKIYRALGSGKEMLITYTDMEETERNLTFDTFGFDNVSQGWETLCTSPKT